MTTKEKSVIKFTTKKKKEKEIYALDLNQKECERDSKIASYSESSPWEHPITGCYNFSSEGGYRNGYTLAVNSICSAGFALSAMPFIDDALLWCPDNDGRLVGGLDLAACITVSAT